MAGRKDRQQFVLTVHNGQRLSSPVSVLLPSNLGKDDLLRFTAFNNWLTKLLHNLELQKNIAHTFHSNPYELVEIDVQAADWFGPRRLGFLKIQAKVLSGPYHDDNGNEKRDFLPGAVFLRGGSVGILLLLEEYDEDDPQARFEPKAVLTIQPRIASGSLAFAEIPAGMLDDSGDFAGKAAEEIAEEVGIRIASDALFNMSQAATCAVPTQPWTSASAGPPELIEHCMYPSAGGCDEFIPLMLCQKRLTRAKMDELSGKATGLRDEGEKITLKVVDLKDLWKEGGRDAKALAALALYEGLKREGKLPSMPNEPESLKPS